MIVSNLHISKIRFFLNFFLFSSVVCDLIFSQVDVLKCVRRAAPYEQDNSQLIWRYIHSHFCKYFERNTQNILKHFKITCKKNYLGSSIHFCHSSPFTGFTFFHPFHYIGKTPHGPREKNTKKRGPGSTPIHVLWEIHVSR